MGMLSAHRVSGGEKGEEEARGNVKAGADARRGLNSGAGLGMAVLSTGP